LDVKQRRSNVVITSRTGLADSAHVTLKQN